MVYLNNYSDVNNIVMTNLAISQYGIKCWFKPNEDQFEFDISFTHSQRWEGEL